MNIALYDYGAGNLHSLGKALEAAGATVEVTADWDRALALDALVLPGVGAFGHAAAALPADRAPVREALEAGLPCLGICLGMQLLLDASDEGPGAGLGVIPGRVTRIAAERLPQIGWNAVDAPNDPLLAASQLEAVYYANSYVCRPTDAAAVTSWSTHEGDRFAATVRRGRVVGTQFHPEKSSSAGVAFVHAFLQEMLA
jgi:imidazole glycerol-phosphate synthase subunit HisH